MRFGFRRRRSPTAPQAAKCPPCPTGCWLLTIFSICGIRRARGRPRSASCKTPVVGYLRLALSRDLAIDDASNGQALRTRDNGRGMSRRPCLLLQPMPTCCCVDAPPGFAPRQTVGAAIGAVSGLGAREGLALRGQTRTKLFARADAELGEHLAEMPLDGARTEEELRADLRVRQAISGEPGDLLFL